VENDLSITIQKESSLLGWANQGVLLLNSILTVEEGRPGSHRNIGWEDMTDAIITGVSRQREGVVFLLWGNYAQTKGKRIDLTKHAVLTACHPSPLSSYCFFGCRHFSKTNEILKGYGKQPINWAQTGLEGDSDDFLRRHFKRA
jgi:uracil-DNA glycosylase